MELQIIHLTVRLLDIKKKLDEDDDIDPLHMRHFSNNFGNVIKNAIGVVGISGLLASFWFFIAKRRRKEDEEEELEIRDNNKDSIKRDFRRYKTFTTFICETSQKRR